MKTYLITGSTSGIGKELTLNLSSSNNILAVYRNLDKTVDFVKSQAIKLIFMDLSKPSDIEKQIKLINIKLDGLIYSAGLADNRPLKLSDPNFALKIFNVNYFSFIELMRLLIINNLFNTNSSSIVISSVTSKIGEKGKSIYSGSKGALESSVRSIVKEISNKGHRLNIIRAGMVDTEIYDNYINELGQEFKQNILSKQFLGIINKTDVLNVVKFLLSDESSKINGATINLDGGLLL
jgi:NAD(P)-dependent dehydrogenase (short-subunit alcohol dehydrogenase family)